MSTAPHKRLGLGLGLLLIMTVLGPSGVANDGGSVELSPAADTVEMRGGTPEEEELLGWAIDRFEAAGLTLPRLVVRFNADPAVCGEVEGFTSWDGETVTIDTCRGAGGALHHNLLHEMAHAWELGGGLSEEQKAKFLAQRGLQAWNDVSEDWPQRGKEQAAEIVAWGLDIVPTRIPTRVADVGPQTDDSLTTAFETLTGRLPLWNA